MSRKLFALIAVLVLVLSACAGRKALKSPVAAPAPAVSNSASDELKLPEPGQPEENKTLARKEPTTPPIAVEKGEGEEKYIVLNFENADLETVIASFGELLKMNYIIQPGVSGKVTIQSYKKFPTKDLFQIFQTILEVNNLTAVRDGSLYRIVPIDTVKQQPVSVGIGKEVKYTLDSSFMTQIIPLQYVKGTEVANLLRSIMPRGSDIIIYEPSNLLIVTATPSTMAKFMKILDAIDVSETEKESVKTFVYYVENGEAKKLEQILASIFKEKGEAAAVPETAAPTIAPPTVPFNAAMARRRPSPAAPTTESYAAQVGPISITAYEDINALIIKTDPRTYVSLLQLLKRLDVPARQVLIEVLVAEVTLSNESQFGIEWLLKRNLKSGLTAQGGFTSGSLVDSSGNLVTTFPSNFFPAFGGLLTGQSGAYNIASSLSALQSDNRLNVLASPQILATDNKEARIEIGSEVPIATGLNQQPSSVGGTTLVSTGQIEYKTVGTILNVTPHITEGNKVTLKISQEVSQVGANVAVAGQNFASFDTRKAITTAVVESGHTLLIGGLMRQSKNFIRTGIPILSKIPILGYLFSDTTDTIDKTELIVLVTPYVIKNQDDADRITSEFRDRIRLMRDVIQTKGEAKKPTEQLNETEQIKSLK
jgi:type II secretory pathway component GspD/PulD (secretin)